MSIKLLITGTDTGVGKTYVSAALLRMLRRRGLSVIGVKPLATGGVRQNNQLYNDDALMLMASASVRLPYSQINPFIFEQPIAPHIAAQYCNQRLTAELLREKCEEAFNYPADICLIEGVGGWYTPLNEHETMADFAILCDCKIILVVGMRLGCLNHALLTQTAIERAGLSFFGWIANCLDPDMAFVNDNVATLQNRLTAPCLGVIPYNSSISPVA